MFTRPETYWEGWEPEWEGHEYCWKGPETGWEGPETGVEGPKTDGEGPVTGWWVLWMVGIALSLVGRDLSLDVRALRQTA